jgi:hypothetical protein
MATISEEPSFIICCLDLKTSFVLPNSYPREKEKIKTQKDQTITIVTDEIDVEE